MKHFTLLKFSLSFVVVCVLGVNNASYSQCAPDVQPPTFTFCPSPTILTYSASSTPGSCNYTLTSADQTALYPQAVDNCSSPAQIDFLLNLTLAGQAPQNLLNPSLVGLVLPVGDNVFTWQIRDAQGNLNTASSCTYIIRVIDDTNPTIACPLDVNQNNDFGVCEASVSIPAPTVLDNCDILSTLNDYNGTSDASDVYPVGNTTVTWTVTDEYGNTSTCQQTVVVIDAENPVITSCPSNQTQTADPGVCQAAVEGLNLTTTDNCAVVLQTWTVSGATIATSSPAGINDVSTSVSGLNFNVGISTINYTIEDAAGNSANCSFTITITDDENPVITCPTNPTTVSTDGGVCTADVFGIAPLTSDNCAVTLQTYTIAGATIATSPITGINDASGETFNLGTSTVTYVIEDAAGNSATCSFDVIVEDNENPVLTCPLDVTVSSDPGVCDAIVAGLTIVSTSDNCSLDSLTWSISGATSASSPSFGFNDVSNQTFNLGVSTVTYTLTDGSGNQSTCSFTVTVEDNENPTLSCPAETVVPNDPGICGATVTGIDVVTFDDNCSVVSQTWSFSGSTIGNSPATSFNDASGQLFNLDTTLVTYTVTDTSGNTATCSFDVIVQDIEAPIITCPSETIVSNDPGICAAVVNGIAPISTDNCSVIEQTWSFSGATAGNSLATGINDASGSTFNLDTTLVTYVIVDTAGNTATCSFDVIVQDTENPIVTCPSEVVVNVDPGTCEATVIGIAALSTADNCSVISLTWDFTGATTGNSPATGFNDASNSIFNGDTTIVTYTVTDTAGNTGTCSFNVIVIDNEPPTITCPADVVVSNDPLSCGAIVNGIAPVSTDDNCAVTTQLWTFTGSTISASTPTGINDASGEVFNLDTTLVLYEVFDNAGNTASCSFEVVVQDNENPIIDCPNDTVVSNDLGVCDAVVNGIAPIASDNCSIIEQTWSFSGVTSGSSPLTGINDASGNTFNLDTTLVTYIVVDTAGNSATCSFEVIVQDTEVPVVVCPNDTTVLNIDPSNCTAIVNDIAAISLDDNCSVISLTWDLTGATTGSSAPTGFNDASGQLFNQDSTLVTYTVLDTAGNVGTCSFFVITQDTVPPTIICPNDTTVATDAGVCDAIVNGLTPIIDDNCGVEGLSWSMALATVSSSIDPTIINDISGQAFNLDTTVVTYVVSDSSGNTSTCTFEVVVQDTTAPLIICPNDTVVSTDLAVCDAIVNGINPSFIENCTVTDQSWTFAGATSGASALTGINDASGQTFNLDTTLVTYIITDTVGLSSSCSFQVIVEDTISPTVICPSDTVVATDLAVCDAVVNGLTPVFDDNCSVVAQLWDASVATVASSAGVGFNDISGNTFNLDTTIVIYTVVDTSGNTGSCSFQVVVQDTTPPTLTCPNDTTVSTDVAVCDAIVNGINIVAFDDNCTVVSQLWDFSGASVNSSPPVGINDASGQAFSLDTTLVTYTIIDTAGNSASCSFEVIVEDTISPTITCPSDTIVPTDIAVCDAVVNGISPIIDDNCTVVDQLWSFSGSTIGNSAATGINDASGNTFNLDTTIVTYTIIDTAGNSATCSFEVIIQDTISPTIICPNDTIVPTDLAVCDAVVNGLSPIIDDNCSVVDQLWTFSGSTIGNSASNGINDASGNTFNLDTTLVTYTIIDTAGNIATCSFEVIIQDTISPTIICPSDTSVFTSLSSCDAVVNDIAPSIDDNCSTVSLTWTFNGSTVASSSGVGFNDASGETFNLDSTFVTYVVTDTAGNVASCSFNVIVNDSVAPIVICPNDTVVPAEIGVCDAVVNDINVVSSTDNCSVVAHLWEFSGSTVNSSALVGFNDASGQTFNLDTTLVTYTIIDTAGNSASCSFEVIVQDTIAPILVCPNDTLVSTDLAVCDAIVTNINVISSSDNCSIVDQLWAFSGATSGNSPSNGINDASGQTFNLDTTLVTYTVVDTAGNTSSCSFEIIVEDTISPTIICPSDTIVYASLVTCDTDVNGLTPVIDDNCTVVDQFWSFVGSTVNDSPLTGINDASGEVFNLDTTVVTYVIVDTAGNSASCSFEVIVQDTVAPVLTCPADTLVGSDPGLCAAIVNGLELAVFENCSYSSQTWVIGGATTDTSAISGINDVSGTLFNTGTSIITYTVVDTVGNTASCQFEVNVEDVEAPIVICPSDTLVYTDPGLCETNVFGIDTVGVSDNCSTIAVLWTISGATVDTSAAFGFNDVSGHVFFGGTNTVTYAGVDAQGNVGTCSFEVTVLDTVPPVIICPFIDTIVYSTATDCGVEVFWAEPVATDNCSFNVTSSDTSGTFFPVGLSTVTYVVTDLGGNTDQCSFEIDVLDTVIPIILGLPTDTLVFCEFDTVTWDLPSIDEACPNVVVSSTSDPGIELPTGYTTVTYNAEDASGNLANPVSFVVYVHPLPTPAEFSTYDVIACESDPFDVSITNYNENFFYDWIYDTNVLLQNDSIYNVYFAESSQTGIYDVVVTGDYGCQNVSSFNVTIDLCEISVPQGISPNNDGINDFFVIDNILAYPETEITIFNRWGAKVYENNNYQNEWSGQSQNVMNIGGDQLPEGTYYYQIVLGGFDNTPDKGKLYTGYVYLKR